MIYITSISKKFINSEINIITRQPLKKVKYYFIPFRCFICKFLLTIKGGENVQKKHTIKSQKLIFTLVFTLIFIVAAMGAVSAADNPSDNQTSVSVNHATHTETSTYQNKSTKDLSNSTKSSNKNVKDPQIWNNGVPVSRGGQPAGYNWGTIQNAINNALPGDTIMLENGVTFSGSGNTQILLLKNLNFDVLNGGTATIDGGGNRWGFTINNGVTASFNNIIFQNLKATIGGGAVDNNGGSVTITNCILRNNEAVVIIIPTYGGAIYQP